MTWHGPARCAATPSAACSPRAGHARRRKPIAPAGLTPREIEVLARVARGATLRDVGAQLGITPKTAGNHVERIYSKIGASSRAEATMFAMQHGLLDTL